MNHADTFDTILDNYKDRVIAEAAQNGEERFLPSKAEAKAALQLLIDEARTRAERSGMAFVHSTVMELTDDKNLLVKLDKVVQERLAALTPSKEKK